MIDALLAAGRDAPAGELARRHVRPRAAALQAAGAVQLFRRTGDVSAAGAAAVCRAGRRSPSESRRCYRNALGKRVAPHEVLVDAPPAELEVDFDIEVYFAKQNVYRRLGDVSPVVRTLAQEQFDDYVKRVRIFVHPRIAAEASTMPDLRRQRLAETIG